MAHRSSLLDERVTYVIYPQDGMDKDQICRIETELRSLDSVSQFYASRTRTAGINFWLADLSHSEADSIYVPFASDIASMYPQAPSVNFDWTTANNCQELTDDPDRVPFQHLVFVCQQPGKSLDDYDHKYWYENDDDQPQLGKDVPVYIVDTGASIDHREFDDIRSSVEWLHVGKDVGGGNAEDDSSTDPTQQFITATAHGTSMLSLVTGKTIGVSKRVKPYLVRMPRRHIPTGTAGDRSGHPTNEDWLEGISMVNDHLVGRSNETKAIILLAFYIPRDSFMREGKDCSRGFDSRMRFLLNRLASKGALIITGSANKASGAIDGFPANYGRDDCNPIPEVLVVRSVHTTSFNSVYTTDFSRGIPHVFAPGAGVNRAEGNRGGWTAFANPLHGLYNRTAGNSCAAAITAGLAAYFLRLIQVGRLNIDKSPRGLKNYICKDLAWPRSTGEGGRPLLAIWNGYKHFQS